MNFEDLLTEQRNRHSTHIDEVGTLEMTDIMNREDQRVGRAVQKQLPNVAKAIDLAVEKFNSGGRLIYIGAGTSGRLGVIDATELKPTYGLADEEAFGIVAGGLSAMSKTIDGAEDSSKQGSEDLKAVNLTEKDIVIGITASGNTPYTNGALAYAAEVAR